MRRSVFAVAGNPNRIAIINFRSRDHVCEDHLEIREAYTLLLEHATASDSKTNLEFTEMSTNVRKMLDRDNLSAYNVYCQEAYSQMLGIYPPSELSPFAPEHEKGSYYIIFYENTYNRQITFGMRGQTRIRINAPITHTEHYVPIEHLFSGEMHYKIEYVDVVDLDCTLPLEKRIRTQKCTISGSARDEFLQLLHQQINGMFPDLDLVGDKCRPNRESFHKLPYSNSIPVKQLLIIPRVDQSALPSEKEFFDGILRIAAKE